MQVIFNTTSSRPAAFILVGIPGLEEVALWVSLPFFSVYTMAIFSNVLLLFILKTDQGFQEPMYFLLSLLAANDLAFPSSTVPRMLALFWLDFKEIDFAGCLVQMFFVHSLSVVESGILVAMAFDRYVAICYPLRYTSILTSAILGKIGLIIVIRAIITILPIPVLVWHLQYCNSNVIFHSYCEHMAVVKVLCGNVSINSMYGLVLSLSITGLDLLAIGLSYVMILLAVFRLPSKEARHKAFSTCGAHVCVILVTYTPGIFSFVTHRFGKENIPHHVHILFANVYIVFPAMLNPIVYGVKTKQIRSRALYHFHMRDPQF
ncbi:olfactory receptor 52L1-like [Pleurodeles waltl]|uniref:olfactory receptor 52L1-like n=1 Tax=Pleurodeles waltl TaxID=8319 RepID=UPI00370946CF